MEDLLPDEDLLRSGWILRAVTSPLDFNGRWCCGDMELLTWWCCRDVVRSRLGS